MRYFLLYIILFFVSSISRGQSNHNSTTFASGDSLQIKEWLKQCEVTRTKNPDDTIEWAQKALSLSEKTHYYAGLAGSYTELGNLYFQKKDYITSLNYYDRAQPVLKETGDEYQLGRVLKNTGDIYSARSYFRQAFDNYREVATLLRKTGQMKLLNECQDAMGNLTLEFGQPKNALNIYRRSLAVKINLNDAKGIIATNSKVAKIFLSLKQYDSALNFTNEVKRLAKDDRDVLTDATIDELIILSFQGKLKEATEVKALAIADFYEVILGNYLKPPLRVIEIYKLMLTFNI